MPNLALNGEGMGTESSKVQNVVKITAFHGFSPRRINEKFGMAQYALSPLFHAKFGHLGKWWL